jgi:RimJ/RimL family protein N-acetyltransferase
MEISNVACRVKLRNLSVNEIRLFYSEIELSTDYLRRSDVLWLPQNEESIYESVTNMINDQSLMQYPSTLAIFNENNKAIGIISCHTFDNKHGVFSYGISILNDFQGKGYAFEAVNLLLFHMFYNRGYYKCIAQTYAFNNQSIKLQSKVGFKKEGILPNAYFSLGKYVDIIIWGLEKGEFMFMRNV